MNYNDKNHAGRMLPGFFRCLGCWRQLLRMVLLGLALALPVVFYFNTADPTTVKVTLIQLGVLAALVIWVFGGIYEGRFEMPEKAMPFLLPAILLALWNAVRYAFSDYRLSGLDAFIRQEAFLITFILTLLNFSRRDIRKVVVVILGGWFVVVAYGLVQNLGLDPFLWRWRAGGRIFSALMLPGVLASYLTLCIPLALSLVYDDENPSWLRYMSGASALASLYLCAGTKNIFAVTFSVFAVVLFTVIARRIPGGIGRRTAFAVPAACIALCIFAVLRFDLIARVNAATAVRVELWGGVIPLIKEQPWFGSGPGSFLVRYPAFMSGKLFLLIGGHSLFIPHALNEFLEQWVDVGVPGLLLWMWLFGILLYRGWKTSVGLERNENPLYVAGLFTAFAAGLGLMMVEETFRTPAPGWLIYFIGGLLGVSAVSRQDRSDAVVILPLPFGRLRPILLASIFCGSCFLAYGSIKVFHSEISELKAFHYMESGKLDEAIREFQKVPPGAPSYIMSRYFLGGVYADRGTAGDYERALRQFREVRRRAPDYVQVHLYEAISLEKLNRIPEAVERMERQVRLDPVDPDTWLKLSELYEKTGESKKAKSARLKAAGAKAMAKLVFYSDPYQ